MNAFNIPPGKMGLCDLTFSIPRMHTCMNTDTFIKTTHTHIEHVTTLRVHTLSLNLKQPLRIKKCDKLKMSKHILKRKAFADNAKVSFHNADQSQLNTSFFYRKNVPILGRTNKQKT